MEFKPINPPRQFSVGSDESIVLSDCGRITLNPDEQITFLTANGAEYDVVRKTWGFYATPSLNGRLAEFGLRGALVRSEHGKAYVHLVEVGQENEFSAYLEKEHLKLLAWLDTDDAVGELESKLSSSPH